MTKSICVVGPKCTVTSAKFLAEALNCDYYSAEPRTFGEYNMVFNYGSSKILRDNNIINHPKAVKICVNKISTLKRVKHGVEWTKNPDLARSWLKADDYVVCREKEEGSKSDGVSIVTSEEFDTTPAKFWTRYFPHEHEVRVVVFRNKIISVYDKQEYKDEKGELFFKFVNMPIEGEHIQVNEMIESIKENIGIDYYGMDILVNEDGIAKLLEINTGPTLHWETVATLLKELKKELK